MKAGRQLSSQCCRSRPTLGNAAITVSSILKGQGSGRLLDVDPLQPACVTSITRRGDYRRPCVDARLDPFHRSPHLGRRSDIAGLGHASDFITGTRTFVNQGNSIVGFSRAGAGGLDLFNGPVNSAFETYDLLTSIGPNLRRWSHCSSGCSSPVLTNGGVLVFVDANSEVASFEAIAGSVPEPGTVLAARRRPSRAAGSFAGAPRSNEQEPRIGRVLLSARPIAF